MSREEAACYTYTRPKSHCPICQDREHKEQVCPWQICRKCGTKGHIQYTCPFEGTVDNYRLERNMAKIEEELIDIKNSLKTMHEFADQIGEDTNKAIKNLKKKIQGQLIPLMGEVYTSIGRESERKREHEAKHTELSGIRNREPRVAKDEEQENTSKQLRRTGTTPRKRETDTVGEIVKQEHIRGTDPGDVFDKEEWEEMVDFQVFWDTLDVGDEGCLEEEVKELHDKYPMDHTLNEHTEDRDRKFLQLEKTRNTSRNKSKVTKVNAMNKSTKEETETSVDERWARELQRRQLARQVLGEKLAKIHGDGFRDGLDKGMNDKQFVNLENDDGADGLLDGFYEDVGLTSEQEMFDILASAKDFLREAVSPYVAEAKERMAVFNNARSEAQVQEDGFDDGFIRGKVVYMDKSGRNKRGDSEDIDFMMDEFYRDVSLIRRSRAPEREMQQIMHNVKSFLDGTVMNTIDRGMAVATGSKPTKDKKKFKFQYPKGKRTPKGVKKSLMNEDDNHTKTNFLVPEDTKTEGASRWTGTRLAIRTTKTKEPEGAMAGGSMDDALGPVATYCEEMVRSGVGEKQAKIVANGVLEKLDEFHRTSAGGQYMVKEFLDENWSVTNRCEEMVRAGIDEKHAKVIANSVRGMLNEKIQDYLAGLDMRTPSDALIQRGEGNGKKGTESKRGRHRDSVGEGRISRRITRSLMAAETEDNKQEDNEVQTREQTTATKDLPMV